MALKGEIKRNIHVGMDVKANFYGIEYEGTVDAIELGNVGDFHMTLKTEDGEYVIIPLNGQTAITYSPPAIEADDDDDEDDEDAASKKKAAAMKAKKNKKK